MITVNEALDAIFDLVTPCGTEEVPLAEAAVLNPETIREPAAAFRADRRERLILSVIILSLRAAWEQADKRNNEIDTKKRLQIVMSLVTARIGHRT